MLSISKEKNVYDNIVQTIGNTPLVKLNSVIDDLPCQIYAKVEYFNPGGSVKDRIGWTIVEDAEKSGRLVPGGTIVESTSGNTGVGLAIAAAIKGYKTIFVMPDKMSQEKIMLLRAFGARVIVTPTAVEPEDPRSYYSVAKRMVEETPNAILANQYHNPVNPQTHYNSTGPEIWDQTNGKITHFVAGMGTGGTISGTGRYLKEKNPDIQIVGVDPIGSILYELHKSGTYTVAEGYLTEGIGEDFLPTTTDLSVVDTIVQTDDKETFLMTRRIAREEGIFIGGSCGAAVLGAVNYAREHNLTEDDLLIVILPDSGSRYLSKIYSDDWMRENGFLNPTQSLSEIRAIDIHKAKSDTSVYTVECETPMEAVVKIMKEQDISQLPVVDKHGHLEGMVSEIHLLSHLLDQDHDHQKGEPVSHVIDREPVIVSPEEKLDSLLKIFNEKAVAVIADGRHIEGILTKIDILDFLSSTIS
ncbi:MAG: cystathionine beta-synthase [Chloroflexota bacterium]